MLRRAAPGSVGSGRNARRRSMRAACTVVSNASAKPRALVSVFDKTKVSELGASLAQLGYEVVSTGGSARALEDAGVNVTRVEQVTGSKEMFDGRVKTLHPAIHGGILADRNDYAHMQSLIEQGYAPIDVVVGNLYPFHSVASKSSGEDDIANSVEYIDIGGPAMLRAAAKNFNSVTVLVDPEDYDRVIEHLTQKCDGMHDEKEGDELRRELAWKAFNHTSSYDSVVAEYLLSTLNSTGSNGGPAFPTSFTLPMELASSLRYGENPHQTAAFYRINSLAESGGTGVGNAILHHGKYMSHNNYLDADAAFECVCDLPEPACAIIKHTNPCGAATKDNLAEAYQLAVQADPVSAFGGIVAFNTTLDETLAREIREFRSPVDGESRMFYEIVIAPSFTADGLETLKGKSKNLRILQAKPRKKGGTSMRQVGGGMLVQSSDDIRSDEIEFECVSNVDDCVSEDVRLAWACVKYVKSNAIAIAKNGRLLGAGSGQPNRVKSAQIALEKAGAEANGATLASDAFFPFSWNDSVEMACKAGVRAIAHPGGSMRDEDAVECCNQYGVSLYTTSIRHFRH